MTAGFALLMLVRQPIFSLLLQIVREEHLRAMAEEGGYKVAKGLADTLIISYNVSVFSPL
jgi:hypothetical protein